MEEFDGPGSMENEDDDVLELVNGRMMDDVDCEVAVEGRIK